MRWSVGMLAAAVIAALALQAPESDQRHVAARELAATRPVRPLGRVRQRLAARSETPEQWPCPEDLLRQLSELSQHEACTGWCRSVTEQLDRLCGVESLDSPVVTESMDRLDELHASASNGAATVRDPVAQSRLIRTAFALKRRLAVWRQIAAITEDVEAPVTVTVTDSSYLQQVIADVEAKLAEHRRGPQWRDYLLVDEAKRLYCSQDPQDGEECRRLAKRILLRLDYSILTPEHSKFLRHQALADYAETLKRIAVEPVNYVRLLEELEHYESRRTTVHARQVAAAQQILRWSPDTREVVLGQELDTNYRNANIRITIGQEILNRLVPQQQTVKEPINDVILGARTWGSSESQTQLRIKLLPSKSRWRIGLEAEGQVASETISAKGPARFRSLGDAVFVAEKEIEVHPHGYDDFSADATAETSAQLTGLETKLDPVPIVSDLVQAIAQQRYRRQAPAARLEMRELVATQARNRLDAEVSEQLNQVREQFNRHLYRPLEQLALNPLVLQMYTTDQELVARYRLAGHHQLAAHTPRPTAPPDSVISIQVHQSALNNLVEQLNWHGREANLRDLYAEVGQLFAFPELQAPEDFPDDVTVRFTSNTPMRFTFEDDRLGFELSLAEMKQGRKRWRNFAVRVHYSPARDQEGVDLIRDQYVELAGPRLKFGDQIALRGVFSRVFAKDQPIDLVSRLLRDDPRLEGYRVGQIAIDDGWLGLAVRAQADPAPPRMTRSRDERRSIR